MKIQRNVFFFSNIKETKDQDLKYFRLGNY